MVWSAEASFDLDRGFQLATSHDQFVCNAEGAKLDKNEFTFKLLSSGTAVSSGSADFILTLWGDFPDDTKFSVTLAGNLIGSYMGTEDTQEIDIASAKFKQ